MLTTSVLDNGYGFYTFSDVPTNRPLEIEIQDPTGSGGWVTTINAGFAIRSDACTADAERTLVVMSRTDYDKYTSVVIKPWDERRGLLIGRVSDCRVEPAVVSNVAIGLAVPPVPPGQVYGSAAGNFIIPDLTRKTTNDNGFYAAAGLPATPNQVVFLARLNATPLVVGEVEFTMQPGAAVIANLPKASERLK
jgi:hypothetical protein